MEKQRDLYRTSIAVAALLLTRVAIANSAVYEQSYVRVHV